MGCKKLWLVKIEMVKLSLILYLNLVLVLLEVLALKVVLKVIISALKELKDGNDIAITPDGPRGPRYSIADGIVAIAKKVEKKYCMFQLNSYKILAI